MVFKYKKFKLNSKLLPFKLSPSIMVELSNIQNNRGYTLEALIDSGADYCLINSRYSELLINVDFKTGILERTMGVEGKGIDLYFHNVELEIKNLPNSKTIIPFGFVDSKTVNVLLGRMGFFEKFKITFDQKNGVFEIDS